MNFDAEKITKNLKSLVSAGAKILNWGGQTLINYSLVLFVATLSPIFALSLFFNYVNTEVAKETTDYRFTKKLLEKELYYKKILRDIDLCIQSEKEKPTLKSYYCENAQVSYKEALMFTCEVSPIEKRIPCDTNAKNRIDKTTSLRAYAGMKNDINDYLDSVELERIEKPEQSTMERIQMLGPKLLLATNVIMALIYILTILALSKRYNNKPRFTEKERHRLLRAKKKRDQ